MTQLTATQQSLIRRGLATPADFGVADTSSAPAAGLTAPQQRLVRRGLAAPEDFLQAPQTEEALLANWNNEQLSKENERAQIQNIHSFLRQREFEEQYDQEGPGLLGRMVDSAKRGFGNLRADMMETGWDPFADQRIDPRTGLPETHEVRVRRNVQNAAMTREALPQQSLQNQRTLREAAQKMDSGNVLGGVAQVLRNPDSALDVFMESAGYNAPAIAAGAATLPASGITAGLVTGAALFPTSRHAYINESLSEASGGDEERRTQLMLDPVYMAELEGKANRYAATLSAFAGGSRALAGPIARAVAPTTARGVVGTGVAAAGLQIALEGAGEGAASRAAGDEIKTSDVVMEMVGGGPMTAVDTAATVLQANRIAADNRASVANQAILDARTRAERLNTETARNIAASFERGVRQSEAEQVEMELTGGSDITPGPGGATEAEARIEDERVARATAASRNVGDVRDALERDLTDAAESDPGNIMASALRAANRDGRLTSAVAIAPAETAATTEQTAPEQPGLFNVVTDPNIDEIEKLRRDVGASTVKKKQKAADKIASEQAAERRAFRRSYIEVNPNATVEEILEAERVASVAKQRPTSAPTDTAAPAGQVRPAATQTPQPAAPLTAAGDNEVVSAGVAAILAKPRPRRSVSPKASAADADTDSFDPSEIDEPDVRAMAEANPNLRAHLAGTAVKPVLYHGTRKSADIGVWKPLPGQLGAHMSAAPDGVAKQFSDRAADGGKIMRLAVNIKNPVRLRDDGAWSVDEVVPQLEEMGKLTPEQADSYLQQEAALRQQLKDRLKGVSVLDDAVEADVDAIQQQRTDLAAQAIRDAGHDGVVYQNRYEVPGLSTEEVMQRVLDSGTRPVKEDISQLTDAQFKAILPETEVSVIAIDSNQVKDIDNNSGEFDSTNPNIKAAPAQRRGAKPSPFLPESAEQRLVDAHAIAKTPAERVTAALEFIDDTLTNSASDTFLRNFVVPALRKLAPLIADIRVSPGKEVLRYGKVRARGLFSPDTGTIEIARSGMTPKVMIHEMLHAVTWGALRDTAFVESDPNVAAAVAGINKVRDLVQAWVDRGGVDKLPAGEAKDLLTAGVSRMIDENGIVDIDELLTYIFTEPSIQRALRQVNAPGMLRDVWRTVVDAMRNLLGLAPAKYDAVDAMLTEGVKLLRALGDNPDAPVSADVVNSPEFQEFGEDTLTRAAGAAERSRPKAAVAPSGTAPAGPDIAARLVSQRSVAGFGTDTATGRTATGLTRTINRLLRGVRGSAPEAALEVLVNADGLTAAGVISLRVHYDELRKVVQENGSKFFSGSGNHWEKFLTMMDMYESAEDGPAKTALANELESAFGQRALDILDNMRTKIDERSVDLIHQLYEDAPVDTEGNKVLSESLIRKLNAIEANLGKYSHRSYAIFDNELAEQHRLWLTKTGPGRLIYDTAVKFLIANNVSIPADEKLDKMGREVLERLASVWVTSAEGMPLDDLRNGLRAVRDNPKAYTKEAIDANATTLADDIINDRRTAATRIYLSERADQSILERREKVPKELRDLMGENADPGFRVLQTVLKQDTLLNKLRAFREISDRFTGTYVFDNRNDAPSGFVQLGTTDLGALANKFVHPDVAAVLETTSIMLTSVQEMFDNPQNFTAGVATGAGKAIRGLKGSVLLTAGLGYAFNLAGSFAVIMANGHAAKLVTDPTLMKEAMQTIVENNVALATGKFTPRVEEMFRRVINDPAMTGEMQQISIADAISRVYEREAIDSARTRFKKYLSGPAGWVWDRAFDLYAAMDLWAKVYNYYAEVSELRGLNERLPPAQRLDEEGIRRTAAERVRQSNLSYERAFPAALTLDRTGITMFSTYTAEVFRSLGAGASLVNTDLKLASELEAEGNASAATYLRAMAAKRAAGLAGVTLGGAMIGKAVTSGVVSLLIMAGILDAADYDEEEEEAILEMARIGTPWLANRDIGVVANDPETGKPVVMDMGRGNPYDPAVNAMRLLGEGKVWEAAKSVAGGVSPLLGFGMGLEGSRTRTPRTVREGGVMDTVVSKLSANDVLSRDSSYFLLNLAEMYAPTQLEEALVKEDFTLSDSIGYRPAIADPIKYLGRGGIGFAVNEVRSDLTADLKSMAVLRDDAALESLVAKTVSAELTLFRQASNAVRLARLLGVSERDLRVALEESSVRRDVAAGLRRENFVPSILSEEVLNRAQDIALDENPDDRLEINARFRKLRRLLNERRKQVLLEENN